MKIYTALIGILMICLMVGAASALTNSTSGAATSGEQALSQVFVSSVTVDPQEFYPYEHGTITVQLTNTGIRMLHLIMQTFSTPKTSISRMKLSTPIRL